MSYYDTTGRRQYVNGAPIRMRKRRQPASKRTTTLIALMVILVCAFVWYWIAPTWHTTIVFALAAAAFFGYLFPMR